MDNTSIQCWNGTGTDQSQYARILFLFRQSSLKSFCLDTFDKASVVN